LLDAPGEAAGAFLGGEQVCLQGRAADRGSDAGCVGWLGLLCVELGEQVAVSVEEETVQIWGRSSIRARQTVGGSAELGVSAEVQGNDAVRIRVLNEQLTGTGLTGQPRS
jgi:hypothetical protein